VPAQFLGGGELGAAEAHVRVVLGQVEHEAAVERDRAQRAAGGVGDGGPGRVEVRVHARPVRRDRAAGAGRHLAGEQPPRQREDHHGAGGVGRVGHDAPGRLAHPLPAPPFGRGNHLGRAVQQGPGVGQQALLAGGEVQAPQGGNRVVDGQGPQEQQAARSGERQVPRPAKGQAAAAGVAEKLIVSADELIVSGTDPGPPTSAFLPARALSSWP
jgi:hypothetical protein